jgi:glycopeptide antibiotics resistance protein
MAATRDIKLIPFLSGDGFGASAPPEVVANVLIFVPFGVYLGLLAPAWMWWKTASVLAGASLVLEIAEYVLAVGRSDISDVIANAAGGLVGLGILSLVRLAHRVRQRPI